MRRLAGLLLATFVLLTAACTQQDRRAFEGFRDLEPGVAIVYRIGVTQTRTASGLGPQKKLVSSVRLDLEEDATSDDAYALVVRSAEAKGEESQRVAAKRLVGRRLVVDLDDRVVGGDEQAFSGTQDVAAADIGMLFALFAPVLPSPRADVGDDWRFATEAVDVPWSKTPFRLTVTNEVVAKERFGRLDAVRVKSVALGNVTFPLPLVAPAERAPGGTPSGSDDLIVNELFENLFSDIDNPVEGVAAAIAAIPLAVAAPFLAIGEALAGLFGDSSSGSDEPALPVVDLAGPLELRSDTKLWDADGRVLDALGNGTMRLSGRIPELPGTAAELSGKTLELNVVWKLRRTHASKLPEPRDPPGRGLLPVLAIALVVVAAALAASRHLTERRRRRGAQHVAPAPRTRVPSRQ